MITTLITLNNVSSTNSKLDLEASDLLLLPIRKTIENLIKQEKNKMIGF